MGGPEEGWGHFARARSLIPRIKERYRDDIEVRIFAECPEIPDLSALGFEVRRLEPGLSVEQEQRAIGFENPFDLCFIETLEIPPALEKLWSEHAEIMVAFDELHQHDLDADIVVSGQLVSRPPDSDGGPSRLRGPEHFVLPVESAELDKLRGPPSARAAEPFDLLVMIGGGHAEPTRLTVEALQRVSDQVDVQPTFVLGFDPDPNLAGHIEETLPTTEVHGYHPDPLSLMTQCDLGIFSAGYSKYEAAFCGLPILMVGVTEHEIETGKAFQARGAGRFLGLADEAQPAEMARHVVELLGNPKERERMARAGQHLVDGRAVERILDEVEKKA